MEKKISYDEMVDQYYSIVYGYILKKITIKEDAEDLTQDIFLNCHKEWERYDSSRASISTWLFAVTDNRLKNYYRDKKVNFSLSDINQDIIAIDENILDNIIDQEVVKDVFLKVMNCLNERQTMAIRYRYFDQLKMDEVAEKLQCSKENARVIIHRSIRRMQKYAQEQGIEWRIEM